MTLSLDIELDSSWDEYKDVPVELLMEDLSSGYLEKDGIKNVTVTNMREYDENLIDNMKLIGNDTWP